MASFLFLLCYFPSIFSGTISPHKVLAIKIIFCSLSCCNRRNSPHILWRSTSVINLISKCWRTVKHMRIYSTNLEQVWEINILYCWIPMIPWIFFSSDLHLPSSSLYGILTSVGAPRAPHIASKPPNPSCSSFQAALASPLPLYFNCWT